MVIMEEKTNQKEKVNYLINEVDEKGYFEKELSGESIRIEQYDKQYKVIIFDSETNKNGGGKIYFLAKPGLEEFLTAMITEPVSILNRVWRFNR
jgi:hypothetical protein